MMTQATPGPKAAVIGKPIAHSRSPLIHGYWLRTYGLPGSYGRVLVEPEDLPVFLRDLAANGYAGCNVTIPHKEGAFAACASHTPTAAALGAVNTLWFEDGMLWGDNTDVLGYQASLDAAAPGWSDNVRCARLLGAGGAARAIVFGLAERGVRRIEIANRSEDRAAALSQDLAPLAARFGASLEVIGWDRRDAGLAGVQHLVNTTSLGMVGQPPLEIDLAGLPEGAIVFDAVYVPLVTPLLARAKARGLVVADGLDMLLHQARPGFERWFGRAPQVTEELRRLAEADLAGA
ncbi:MAG TPA: shikimate dehydrogenase [Beijerinckiaceae bacterium]|nr:shikimate dehydrogenase [Beijerinckiaceae bacterium]